MESREKEREAKIKTGLAGKSGGRKGRCESEGSIESYFEKGRKCEIGNKEAKGKGEIVSGETFKRSQKTMKLPIRGKQGEEGREESRIRKVAEDLEKLIRGVKEKIREH